MLQPAISVGDPSPWAGAVLSDEGRLLVQATVENNVWFGILMIAETR